MLSDQRDSHYQESYFHWLFGVEEPDCFGAVSVATGKSALFIPRMGIEYTIWLGRYGPHFQAVLIICRIPTQADFAAKYEVDQVFYIDEVEASLLLHLMVS